MLRWAHATRPRFLTASVLPVLVGTAWGARAAGAIDLLAGGLAVLAVALAHSAANVFNDVGDELTGADRGNSARIYPYSGGSRFIQNGVMELRSMLRLSAVLLLIALALGAVLALLRGPAVLALGLAGLGLGICYSLPGIQLSARGVGEAAVAVAFGFLPVAGAAWLQTSELRAADIGLAFPIAMWVAAVVLVNEVPDRAADARAGKRTLAVRLGIGGARRVYVGLQLAAAAAITLAAVRGSLPAPLAPGSWILLAVALWASRKIGAEHHALERAIEMTLLVHALGCLLLLVGAIAA